MVDVSSLEPPAGSRPHDAHDALELFGAAVVRNAYGSETTFTIPPYVRGPGRRTTTGPQDAQGPNYWMAEAEALVMRLVRDHGEVTSDDVRAVYRDEPSATGAAIGALFKRLGRQGRLVLVAHRPSSRPEARGRVVGVWRPGGAR